MQEWRSNHNPPPKSVPGVSNRVDGMALQIIEPSETLDTLVASLNRRPTTATFAFTREERNCWRCRGWGHEKEACPSADRARPIWACIQGLQSLQTSNARRRPVITRRPGPSPLQGRNQRTLSNLNESEYEDVLELIEYDDGGVFTISGEVVREPTPPGNQTVMGEAVGVLPDNKGGNRPEAEARVAEAAKSSPDTSDATPENGSHITYASLDQTIESAFNSSYTAGGLGRLLKMILCILLLGAPRNVGSQPASLLQQ